MAGYCGYSKSNNAIEAEENGRFPASILAKKIGVKSGAIKEILSPSEWHHTSKMYNKTNYYDMEEALERIDELKSWREPKKENIVYKNCSVEFLEWGGSRKHPRATVRKYDGLEVNVKGDWFEFEIQLSPTYKKKIRKKKNTNGFFIKIG